MRKYSKQAWLSWYVWVALCGLVMWVGNCSAPPAQQETPTEQTDAGGGDTSVTPDISDRPERKPEIAPDATVTSDKNNPPEDNPEPPPESPGERPTPPDNNRPYGLTQRIPNTTCKFPGAHAALGSMKATVAFPNLLFSRPVYLTAPPDGSNRLFLVEQHGVIRVLENRGNIQTTKVFLDIQSVVSRSGNEEGLLGLAFHPNYKINGYFYVYYSNRSPTHYSIVSRFQVSSQDPDKADPNSEKQIFTIKQPYSNHNGGMIEFGPDGYLYISLGDGGSAGDPHNAGQDLQNLLGKILRIDVNQPAGGKEYSIPADNPFVNTPNALGEIWAYGLRNVWRFSFDRVTGDLWAGDVGQSALEEIDLIIKGGNYGWRMMEGTRCYNPGSNCQKPGMILPIVEHDRNEAKSITGGYVYRGKKNPQLYGAYVYADYVTGKIWALRYDGKKVTEHKLLLDTFKGVSSFGEDRDGELYFTTFETPNYEGKIYTLEPATPGGNNTFPLQLSQTGCFKSLKPLQPAAGLIPYDVAVPLWSDHLDKQRWIALPGTSQITYKQEDGWEFPDNSVIVKHFSIQQEKGKESSRRHIETRFLVKQNGDWRGYSYLWNKDQTDATLLEGNADVPVEQKDPANQTNNISFTHTVPNRNECLQCHTQAAGRVLGLETLQMNRDFDYNGVVDNQLRAMNHIKLFVQNLPSPSQLPGLPNLTDTTVPVDRRARAYLHANCAYCHRPGVAGTADTDLRYKIPLAQTKSCNVAPVKGDLGVPGAMIITPGKPEASTLFLRTQKRGTDQMPQIGTKLPHPEAVDVLRQWIQGLRDCSN